MSAIMVNHRFTFKIVLGMAAGILVGLLFKYAPLPSWLVEFVVGTVCVNLGQIFLNLIRMLVVPVVLVSLVCGVSDLKDIGQLGRIGFKSLALYLFTTALAITLALVVAKWFAIGQGLSVPTGINLKTPVAPSIANTFIGMFTTNPFTALAEGNMLQIIVFALLFGLALTQSGSAGAKVAQGFHSLNKIIIRLMMMIMQLAPYGIFCLLTVMFAKFGWPAVVKVSGYFAVVPVVLLLQLTVVYSFLLKILAKINPLTFFKKMYGAMLFAFSVSSSSASIPVVLSTVKEKLGVAQKVAAFVIPVGATINMDGTAIMQGVATVFIANVFAVHLSMSAYLTVILMATLASIGTAGVPGVGLVTLAMVLQQVGLPIEGIALIIGVDRILDMLRTAVNVAGDATIACVVAKSENCLDQEKLQDAA